MSSISIVGKSRRVIDTPEYTIDELAGIYNLKTSVGVKAR